MTYNKTDRYQRVYIQIADLLLKSENKISRMATINAILYAKMKGFFWVGFYMLENGKLVVGPYQGPLACLELTRNKGVCWAAINSKQTVVVKDVHEFPDHIACDSRSNSEIVVPVYDKNNELIAVLDIDSDQKENFDETDKVQLEKIVGLL